MKSISLPSVLFRLALLCILVPFALFFAFDAYCSSGGHAAADVHIQGSADTTISGAGWERNKTPLAKDVLNMSTINGQNSTVPFEMHGLGAPMARLLETVERGSIGSRQKFAELWGDLPRLLPDLYKVHITL